MFISLLSIVASVISSRVYSVCGPHICDESGNTVIFRGFNLSPNSKVPDFKPLARNTREQLAKLVELGTTAVRFPFIWEAYEPLQGQYDITYLDYYRNVLDVLNEFGIQAILDFHQDGYSRYALNGCGSGFPKWSIPKSYTTHEPVNTASHCSRWGLNIAFSPFIRHLFNDFYGNVDAIRDTYIDMVDRVVGIYCRHPAILGIDLLNEPIGDEINQLSPLYRDILTRIRGNGCEKIVFLTPNALSGAGINKFRLKYPKGFSNIVFAPHFYNPANFIGLPTDFNLISSLAFNKMSKLAKTWKAPFFLTEFGSPSNYTVFIDEMFDKVDEFMLSSTQWAYTPGWDPVLKDGWNGEDFSVIDDKGNTRVGYRARPYAKIIAGTPTSIFYDTKNEVFRLSWRANGNSDTLIHVPDIGKGWLSCPNSSVTCVLAEARYEFTCSSKVGVDTLVSIAIVSGKDESKCP